MKAIYLDCTDKFKPGDPAPSGYMAWHAWADVQYRSGLRQKRCRGCGRFLFPQEVEGHKCGQEETT